MACKARLERLTKLVRGQTGHVSAMPIQRELVRGSECVTNEDMTRTLGPRSRYIAVSQGPGAHSKRGLQGWQGEACLVPTDGFGEHS